MKNFILSLLISLSSLFSFSQSGWQSGNYYMYQGQAVENCGNTYPKYDWNGYLMGYYVSCQTLVWERVQYSGYVHLWGPAGWYTEWRNSWAWYCYWSPVYEKRVW